VKGKKEGGPKEEPKNLLAEKKWVRSHKATKEDLKAFLIS
jgi:hypothetical protein